MPIRSCTVEKKTAETELYIEYQNEHQKNRKHMPPVFIAKSYITYSFGLGP